MDLPPCGLYKTTAPLAGVPAGRLVLFHNHGDPGPGIYLPESWAVNRATFAKSGRTIDPANVGALAPLPDEGMYQVKEPFFCCANECRQYGAGLLVQLGYNGGAEPILFLPRWSEAGLSLPTTGQRIDEARLEKLERLTVQEGAAKGGGATRPGGDLYH